MKIGELYLDNKPLMDNDPKYRYVKVLSVTLTHVYIRYIYSGYQVNIGVERFKQDFSLVTKRSQ